VARAEVKDLIAPEGDADFFGFDYSDQVPSTDEIEASSWALAEAEAAGIVPSDESFSGLISSVKLTIPDGAAGEYVVANTITTVAGRDLTREFLLTVVAALP
jgi:hypothetical protein